MTLDWREISLKEDVGIPTPTRSSDTLPEVPDIQLTALDTFIYSRQPRFFLPRGGQLSHSEKPLGEFNCQPPKTQGLDLVVDHHVEEMILAFIDLPT